MAQTGNATGALALSGSATTWYGGASASLSLNASANGVAGIEGSANASLRLSGGATSIPTSAVGSLELSGVAVGVVGIIGNARASLNLDAAMAGFMALSGGAVGSLQLRGNPGILFAIPGNARGSISLNALAIALMSETFQAFVMNTKTLGAASYTNYGFNSLFKGADGFYYGCNASGIFRLTGKNDDGAQIDASIICGTSDFSDRHQKYFPDAYLAIRCEGEMEFTLTIDQVTRRTYTVEARDGQQGVHTKRRKLAQGLKGRYVQPEIRNVAGADFDLQGLELITEPTGRT